VSTTAFAPNSATIDCMTVNASGLSWMSDTHSTGIASGEIDEGNARVAS
jgi:hypothetical protein